MFCLFLPMVCLQTLSCVCNGSIQPGFLTILTLISFLIWPNHDWLAIIFQLYLSALTLTSVGHVMAVNLTQVYGSFPAVLLSSNKTIKLQPGLLLTGPVRWCWGGRSSLQSHSFRDQTNKYNKPGLIFSGCLWKHEICSWLKINF